MKVDDECYFFMLIFFLYLVLSKDIFGVYYKKLTKCLFSNKNCFTFAPRKSTELGSIV